MNRKLKKHQKKSCGQPSGESVPEPLCLTEDKVLVLGEILVDELPTGPRPGGAPFNFSQHLHQLGFEVFFASRIGNDSNGKMLSKTVLAAGLETIWVQRDPDHPTGRVVVSLDKQGVPQYRIATNTAYDNIDFEALDAQLECQPDLVYFGSLIQRTETARKQLQALLKKQPDSVVRMYDMNLRPGCIDRDIILPSLQQSNLLKLNEEELETTGNMFGTPASEKGHDYLARSLMDVFEIRQIALTRGKDGSVLYTQDGRIEQGPGPLRSEEIVDTVGAGDAYAAALASGYLNGWPPEETLRIATQLAEHVCTVAGAVPPNRAIYNTILNLD